MITMKWTDSGSAGMLKTFFNEQNRTSLVLDELLVEMGLEAISFLGAGATGCVFEVYEGLRPPRRKQALKVVVGKKNIASLQKEYLVNKTIFAKKSDVAVVKATAFKVCSGESGAGMLMEESGTGALRKMSCKGGWRINIRLALDALASVHSTAYHHGDARIANLLICTDAYKWCDLQYAFCHESEELKRSSFCGDITTLITSIGKEVLVDSKEFQEALDKYVKGQDPTVLLNILCKDGKFDHKYQIAEVSNEVDGGQDQASENAVSQLKQWRGGRAPCCFRNVFSIFLCCGRNVPYFTRSSEHRSSLLSDYGWRSTRPMALLVR